MLVGPSVAGLAITAIAGGAPAMRDYGARLVTWRVGIEWYVAALFIAPAAITLTVFVLSAISPAFTPAILVSEVAQGGGNPIHASSAGAFLLMALAVGFGAGFFEELGWTGVAVPKLVGRHGTLATGVGVGLVWGAWHYLAIHWGSGEAMGSVPAVVYLAVALFAFLPPYRVLMTWVYQHTRSLLVGILMHASLTSSMLILGPAVSGRDLLLYDLVLGSMLWMGAAVVLGFEARVMRRQQSYEPASV